MNIRWFSRGSQNRFVFRPANAHTKKLQRRINANGLTFHAHLTSFHINFDKFELGGLGGLSA